MTTEIERPTIKRLIPFQDYCVMRPVKPKERMTRGGIVIRPFRDESTRQVECLECSVVAVGPGITLIKGTEGKTEVRPECCPGDVVLVSKHHAYLLGLDDDEYVISAAGGILAKIVEDEAIEPEDEEG